MITREQAELVQKHFAGRKLASTDEEFEKLYQEALKRENASKVKFEGIEIKDMTNKQLQDAEAKIIAMSKNRNDQLAKRKARHEKIDLTNENPAYTAMVSAIDQELKNRGL